MLVLLGIALLAISVIILVVKPYYGFLLVIISKPILDMTWSFRPGGFSLVQVASVLVPVLLLPQLLQSAFWKDRGHRAWMIIGFIIFIGQFLSATTLILQDSIRGFDSIFRSLNVLLAFLMIPAFATNSRRLREVLLAFIIAGFAPLVIFLYGDVTGTVWRSRITVELERNIGLFHGAVSIRHFGLQSILVGLMYLQLFPPKKLILKGLLIAYMVFSTYMLYKGYTRGGMATLAVWAVIWIVVYRKLSWGIVIAALLIGINVLTDGAFLKEVIQLFSKEVDFYEGGFRDNSKILNGRVGLWQEDISDWFAQGYVNRLFGGYYTGIGTHNEILRALMANGLLGLCLYVIGIVSITSWSTRWLLSGETSRYGIFAIMLLAMYSIEAFGATPGTFPQYQWFIFGFIGAFLLNSRRYETGAVRQGPHMNMNFI